jgi:two-component system NtrC family sensor kinase
MAAKLALLLALVQIVAFGGFAYLSVQQQRRVYVEHALAQATRFSDVARLSLRSSMMRNRRAELEDELRALARDPGVVDLQVVGHQGRLVASAGALPSISFAKNAEPCSACHETDPPRAQMPASRRSSISEARRTLDVVSPIESEPGCVGAGCHARAGQLLGVLHLGLSLVPMDRQLAGARDTLLVAGAIALALTGACAWLVISRWLHRPVRALVAATHRIAAGELETTAARSADELGLVADSLNEMAHKLKASQEQVVRSAKLVAVGKLAAGVAHEINNPLTGILTYAEELLEDAAADDPKRADYEVIVRETLRCRAIVRNLLDFARQTGPSFTRARLCQVVEDAVKLVRKQASFRNVQIETRCPGDLPELNADPRKLQQVLLNLLVNASEAMPAGGTVRIEASLEPDGRRVVLSVADTGSGIPAEIRERIFEPFYSTKEGRTDGLGLAISWNIVEQHGGVIELDSEVGRGTTFRIKLPVRGAEEPPPRAIG